MSLKLGDKLQGPGLVFCTFDLTLAKEYSEYLEKRTEVKLLGKTYFVVASEWRNTETYPGFLYWFELGELITCQ